MATPPGGPFLCDGGVVKSRWTIGVALSVVTLLPSLISVDAGAAAILPPSNPASNISPSPDFTIVNGKSYTVGSHLPACWRWARDNLAVDATTAACVRAEVAATNRAQSAEGLGPITLPTNFAKLSPVKQLLVLVDIERVSRGETPVIGVAASLDQLAQLGALARRDPSLPSAAAYPGATGGFTANWAGAISALDANYAWMYQDGWAGSATFNEDCTSASSTGCWGHRDDILANGAVLPCNSSSCSLVMGGGYVNRGAGDGFSSYSELFVQVDDTPSDLIYTWAMAVADGAQA
jgi:hypothetical protein